METAVQLAVIAVASFVNTLTGFGFALVAVPGIGLVTDAKVAVVLTPILYAMLAPFFLWSARREIDIPLFKSLMLSSLAGLPIGVVVLALIDDRALRLLIGATIVVAALLMLADFRRPIHSSRAPVVVGFVTGILTTSITVSGPLVVLFMANQGLAKDRLRATVGVFLLGMMPLSLVLYVLAGLVTAPTLFTGFKLMPALVVGYLLAVRVLPLVDQVLFRRMTILLIIAAGTTMMWSGLGRLLA